jgi:transcriptional regulator with XRE-family HTH domain
MNKLTQKTNVSKLLKRYPKEERYRYLAKALGITPRYVRLLEKGKAPSVHLRKLIKILLDQPNLK